MLYAYEIACVNAISLSFGLAHAISVDFTCIFIAFSLDNNQKT